MRLHNPLSPEPIRQAGNKRQENEQDKEEGSARRRKGSLHPQKSPRREEQLERPGKAPSESEREDRSETQTKSHQVRSIGRSLEERSVPEKDHRWHPKVLGTEESSRSESMTQSQEPEERAGSLMHGTVASLSMEVTWK
jgi:hypothetical protein